MEPTFLTTIEKIDEEQVRHTAVLKDLVSTVNGLTDKISSLQHNPDAPASNADNNIHIEQILRCGIADIQHMIVANAAPHPVIVQPKRPHWSVWFRILCYIAVGYAVIQLAHEKTRLSHSWHQLYETANTAARRKMDSLYRDR